MDMSLNLVDNVMTRMLCETSEFKDFCNTIDDLQMVLESNMYMEAVSSTQMSAKNKASNIVHNTGDSIKAVGNIYSNTTDAGGSILNATWKVVLSSLNMISKILKWVSKHISKLPLMVSTVIDGMIDIPDNIKNKIKGNIKLYITENDIKNLFAKSSVTGDYSILNRLNIIIGYMDKLTKGDLWTTYMFKKSDITDFFKQFDDNYTKQPIKYQSDIKLIKNIIKEYKYISTIKFQKSVIDMNDPKVVDIYFSKTPNIEFNDVNGNKRVETYLGSLELLLEFLNKHKNTIESLNESLSNKLNITLNNSDFSRLSPNSQKTISELFQTIGKIVEIIGNITRYIMMDTKTIENTKNQIKAATTINNDDKNDDEGK